ncbi:MAG: hypothetical protein NUV59_04185 [Patescibacteria group bacterium]|nr:hypothetical protein [Patescibacteria group bacterium]
MIVWPVIVGSVINLFGSSYYIWNTIRGVTKPNRVTWLMWAIAPLIGSAAAFTSGVSWAVLPVFMSGFFPLLVFLSSFVNKNAYWQLGRFDYVCGGISALALLLWALTSNPIIAIILAIAADAFAGIPTVIKAWKYPETETATGYAANGINNLTSFFVIRQWTFASYAFPLYLVAMNTYFVFALLRKRVRFS